MDDAIDDAAVAEDRRLGYPSRHDWNWIPTLGDGYGEWLDAAYPMINRLARERDEARAEVERLRAVVREYIEADAADPGDAEGRRRNVAWEALLDVANPAN